MEDVRFLPAGDTALVVEFGAEIDRGLSNRVLSLSERVRQAKIPGVTETVPTFRSLAVHYDPLVTSAEPLVAVIREFLAPARRNRNSARGCGAFPRVTRSTALPTLRMSQGRENSRSLR